MSAVELVRRFSCEWPGLSPDEIGAFFTDDCVYQHDSIPRALVGSRAIAGAIEIFRARFEHIECEMVRIAEDRGVVLCERTEKFTLPGGRVVRFRAMATVQVRDDQILHWYEYSDIAALRRQVDLTEA